MTDQTNIETAKSVGWWQPVLFAAMAGGMGWGIRGQYGHETGAMIAGLLVCLTLAFLLCPRAASLPVARAVALGTIAMGFGGTMTYGQTISLTQDLIGNWAALRWGLLGLGIKGAVWIGFAGLFFGMGLSGVRYRALEAFLLMLGLLVAYYIGAWLLNSPFDPENKVLPAIYFSASWHWEPDAVRLNPRPESWGGLLVALVAGIAYASAIRKDRLAWRLALWGFLGGLIGFPLGQSLQAYHAWNPEVFQQGFWTSLDPHMNWWNMMEITFGATMGAMLGLGLWLHRKEIRLDDTAPEVSLNAPVEWLLIVVHATLLVVSHFLPVPSVEAFYDLGLVMGVIPIAAVAGGRWWPYMLAMPITALPIAGKTLRDLAYESEAIGIAAGWIVYLIIPMALAVAAGVWLLRAAEAGQSGREFARRALLLALWLYTFLNWAIFRYPWPWEEWTYRTPSGIILGAFAIALTALALTKWTEVETEVRKEEREATSEQ